jgi:hypothetical protein
MVRVLREEGRWSTGCKNREPKSIEVREEGRLSTGRLKLSPKSIDVTEGGREAIIASYKRKFGWMYTRTAEGGMEGEEIFTF